MFDGRLNEDVYLRNLEYVRARIERLPAKHISPCLDIWDCGTYACLGGHCARWFGMLPAEGYFQMGRRIFGLDWYEIQCFFGSDIDLPLGDHKAAKAECLRRLDKAISDRKLALAVSKE